MCLAVSAATEFSGMKWRSALIQPDSSADLRSGILPNRARSRMASLSHSAVTKIAVRPDGHWLSATESDQRSRLWRLPRTAEAPGDDSSDLAAAMDGPFRVASDSLAGWRTAGVGWAATGWLVVAAGLGDRSSRSLSRKSCRFGAPAQSTPAAAFGCSDWRGNTIENSPGGENKVPFEKTLWLQHLKTAWRSACKSDPLLRGKRTHLGNDLTTGSCVVFEYHDKYYKLKY